MASRFAFALFCNAHCCILLKLSMYLYHVIVIMASHSLKICSYNTHGIANSNWGYMRNIMTRYDFLLLQEHWLSDS